MKKDKLKAASIKYFNENTDTPLITSFGIGELARKIIEEAKKNNVRIMENKTFFEHESLFKIGKEIPYEVYKIVAEILSCILKTNKMEIIDDKKNSD